MPKAARGKSGTTSEACNWEAELAQAVFQEPDWRPLVYFLGPQQYSDVAVVNLLSDTIKTGVRKLFNVVDYYKLLVEAKEIATQTKGSKGKGVPGTKPQYSEICEQVKLLLDQGEKIPVNTLAKLIKFKLLSIKASDIERRNAEKKLASTTISKPKLDQSASKTVSPNRARSAGSPGKGGKKGAKKEPEKPLSPKKETKLKKRGEESEVIEYIDDEPDGPTDPHHYIILTGFNDAALFNTLIDIQITINAAINLRTEYDLKLESIKNERRASLVGEQGDISVPPEQNEEDQIKVLCMKEEIAKFWEESDLLVKHTETGHELKNMAKFEVVIQEHCFPDNLEQSFDPKGEFAGWLYTKVADVCFDLLKYMEQYGRYLDHLRIIDVSTNHTLLEKKLSQETVDSADSNPVSTNAEKQDKTPSCDLRYYDQLMSNVPVQCESVPLILNCLLEQVVAVTDGPNPADEPPKPRADGMDDLIGQFWDRQMAIYGPQDTQKLWKREKERKPTPDIIYHGDEKRMNLLNIMKKKKEESFQKAEQIEDKMRDFHPYAGFVRYLQPSQEEWVENCLRRRQLYNFCRQRQDITEEKFERAMRQYIFEALPIDGNIEIIQPQMDNNNNSTEEQLEKIYSRWDYPYCDLSQQQSSVYVPEDPSIESVNNESLRKLDSYNWLEHLEPSVLHQVLDKGSDIRPYLDTYYNRGNNTLLVVLHNPVNENLENTFQWESWLHSDVGFRNYLEHIAYQIQDWTNEQQKIADELKEAQKPVEEDVPAPAPPPLKERSRWGLKTRAQIAEENEKGHGKSTSASRDGSPKKSKSPEKKKSESKTTGKSSAKKGSRNGSSKRPASTRSKVSFCEETPSIAPSETMVENYAFVGYNLGDKLLHCSIDQAYLFPQNGSLVRIEKLSYVEQTNCVQITVMCRGDTFAVNFANPIPLDELNTSNVMDKNKPCSPVLTTRPNSNAAVTSPTRISPTIGVEGELLESEVSKRLLPLPDTPPYICSHSNITANLSDGVLLSFSTMTQHSESFECAKVSKILSVVTKQVSQIMPQPSTQVPVPPKSPKGRKGKKEDDQKLAEEQDRKEAEDAKRIEEREKEIEHIFKEQQSKKNLYVTTPNAIHLSFKHGLVVNDLENLENNPSTFLVRQERLMNEKEEITLENCDQVKELYRCVTSDGLVIKYNSDETIEILSAHGDIYHSTPYQTPEQKIPPTTVMPINTVAVEPAKIEDTPSRNTPSRGKKGSGSASKQQQNTSLQPESITEPTNETENESNNNNEKKKFPLSWNVTKGLSGEKWFIDSSGHEEFVENMMIADASCFESNQVLQTREDGVIIVNRENGTSIVEYLDGTRITMATKTRVDHVVNQETGESREVEAQYQEVLVEHEFYPTTIIDLNKSSIQCEFPNGRAITGFQDGGYVVAQQQDKQMIVSTSGELYIHPKRSIDISQSDIPCSKGTCVMKQTTQNALQIIDHQGNQFEVDADGSYRVQKGQHSHDEDVSSEIKPRYFVVHSDGSGEELLRYEDVCHYLQEAESNPSAAILHGGLEGDEEATTLTVLKPHSGYVEDIWRPSKKESNIIPISLRERDFKAYDSRINEARKKSAWPGSDKPVKLGPWVPPKSSPQITCPETLEVRHLINYKELTAENRKEIIEGINQYGEYIAKQQDDVEKLRNIDDRSEEEKIKAQRIKEHFLHQEASKSTDAEKMIADQYLDALRPPKPPSPKRAQTERASEEWERDKQELRDLGYHKYMLRTEDFPPYFLTEQGQRFLRENPSPDMKMLSDRLAEESKHPTTSSRADSIPSSQGSITPHDKIPVSSSTPHQEDSSFLIEDPSSSMSMKNDYSINSISPYDSSTSGRPLNPTPQRAKNTSFTKNSVPLLESKLDPITESNFTEQPSSMNESSKGMLSRSLMYDVAGSPRKGSVKTPSSILGSRPNAIPNEKFTNIEDPVRRQSKTASVYGSVDPESTSKLRGFILLPDVVDFGVLTEGYSYTHQVTMKNVGIDSCRYKIKQPPLSTGLKIIYQPGQVAAGMQVTFDVEIFAVAVGVESGSCGIGQISHHVEIISETDILYLPVIATIITQDELQHPSEMTPQGGPSKGTLILDKRPSSREMLRSRKE